MHYIVYLNRSKSLDYLSNDEPSLHFRQFASSVSQVLIQITAIAKFKCHINRIRSLTNIAQANHVLVPNLVLDSHLIHEVVVVSFILVLFFRYMLNCECLPVVFAFTEEDFTEVTLTK